MKPLDRLHLGCGLVAVPEWLNVDGSWQVTFERYPLLRRLLVRLGFVPKAQLEIPWSADVRRHNVRKRLPFSDDSFIAVYSSHLLEHLDRSRALQLLQECRRVLKRGGICRAVVPDLEHLVREYTRAKEPQPLTQAKRDPARDFIRSLQFQSEEINGSPWPYRLYQKLTDFHRHKWMYDKESLILLFVEAGFQNVEAKDFRVSQIPGIEEVEQESRVQNGAGICVEGVKP